MYFWQAPACWNACLSSPLGAKFFRFPPASLSLLAIVESVAVSAEIWASAQAALTFTAEPRNSGETIAWPDSDGLSAATLAEVLILFGSHPRRDLHRHGANNTHQMAL